MSHCKCPKCDKRLSEREFRTATCDECGNLGIIIEVEETYRTIKTPYYGFVE